MENFALVSYVNPGDSIVDEGVGPSKGQELEKATSMGEIDPVGVISDGQSSRLVFYQGVADGSNFVSWRQNLLPVMTSSFSGLLTNSHRQRH